MMKRMIGVFAAVLFAFSGVLVRLYGLSKGDLQQAASAQSKVTVTVARARGTIYDRNLTPLTNTTFRYAASVVSTPQALAALADSLPQEEWQPLREQLQSGKPVVVNFQDNVVMADGVTLALAPVRYGEEPLAAHLIGYLGDDGIHGVSGIERAYDEWLIENGGDVRITYETDGRGQVLTGGEIEIANTLSAAKGGVLLTLDAAIQRAVELRCASLLDKGAVVVTDPENGDVLALASFPTFDPSRLADYLAAENSPLFNRCTAAYNCGSVFKIVSAAAALEAGVPVTQTFYCAGSLAVGNNRIKCHHVLGHGELDLYGGFIQSCNPYFIQLIQLTGSEALYRMASSLSFNSALIPTAGYTTASAVFPAQEDLLQPTALANVSFGQGELAATPLHIAQMTATTVTDGKLYPLRLVKGTVDAEGRVTEFASEPPVHLYSTQTAQALRMMMCGAVEEGNGAAAQPAHGHAGGKSGTAQTGWLSEDGSTMVQSWFTGFYPAEDPRYVITVLSEDAERSGKQAAPVFGAVCEELYRLDKTLDKSEGK